MGSVVRGTRVGSEGEVFVRVSECLKNSIDMRFVVCDNKIRQMFDDRHETMRVPGPGPLEPGEPFFGPEVTNYIQASERRLETGVDRLDVARDLSRGKMVEGELDAMIRRRHEGRRKRRCIRRARRDTP